MFSSCRQGSVTNARAAAANWLDPSRTNSRSDVKNLRPERVRRITSQSTKRTRSRFARVLVCAALTSSCSKDVSFAHDEKRDASDDDARARPHRDAGTPRRDAAVPSRAEHVAACQQLFARGWSPSPVPAFAADLMPFFSTHCNFGGCHLGPGSSAQLQLGDECAFDVHTNACVADASSTSSGLARSVYDSLLAPSITTPAVRRVEPGKPEASFILFKLSGCQDAFEPLTGCGGCGRSMPGGAVLRDTEPESFDALARWVASGAPFD